MAENQNLLKVIHISLSFFLLFTAFYWCANVVSEVYSQNHYGSLGFYTIAALYLSFAFSSLTCGPIVAKLGYIRSIQLGAFWYLVWVAAGILPVTLKKTDSVTKLVWSIMILAAILNGFGASILWVGQGIYVSRCCNTENSGLYFGLFWSLLMFSQIFGNLMAAFVIDLFSQTVMFSVMAFFSFFGVWSFLFLRKPEAVNPIGMNGKYYFSYHCFKQNCHRFWINLIIT